MVVRGTGWVYPRQASCFALDKEACSYAVEFELFDMLKWLRTQTPLCPWDKEECLKMPGKEMKQWIIEH